MPATWNGIPRDWDAGLQVTATIANQEWRDRFMYLKDSPTIDGTPTVTGNLTLTAALVSNSATNATSTITGAIQTDGGVGIVKDLWVGGISNFAQTVTCQAALNVTGTITGNVTGNLTGNVTGNISGNVTGGTISGTTGVFSSTLAATGNFAINTNKFNVTASSGDTTVAGTLGVTGATSLGVLTVTTSASIVAASIASAGGASDTALTVTAGNGGYTGTVITGNTTRAANAAFNVIDLQANSVSQFMVTGAGVLTAAASLNSPATITNTLTVNTSASIVAATVASAGDVGDTALAISASNGGYTGTVVTANTARAANVAFSLLDLQANSVSQFKVGGTGVTVQTNDAVMGTTAPVLQGRITSSFNGSSKNGIVLDETANTSGCIYAYFGQAGTAIGSISRNAATAAVLYNTSSDARLKSPITPFTDALARVCQINAGTYTMLSDGAPGSGVIAQELHAIYPDAVTPGRKDDDMWGVDYGKLTPLLIGAIQELYKEVQALKHG